MISVDRLIKDLTALNIDHQEVFVEVQVDVGGAPHRLPLGALEFAAGGLRLTLVGEPAPVPDPIIAPVPGVYNDRQHTHVWDHDIAGMTYRCIAIAGCVTITHDELIGHPIPQTEAQGFALLNHIAETKLTPQPADAPTPG